MKKIFFFLFFILSFSNCFSSIKAASQWKRDSRRQIPLAFQNSWIYLSGGIAKSYFTSSDFAPGYQFSSQKDAIGALRLSIGHYFNPYLALSFSLMRGIHSNKFNNWGQTQYSVNENLFTAALRPTLPLSHGAGIYAEGGLGFISRKGFNVNTTTVVKDASTIAPLLGAGVYYKLPYGILLGLDSEYTPAIKSQKQPAILYAGLGIGFLTSFAKSPIDYVDQYFFPLNLVEISYFNQTIFYADEAKYFSPPYIPIFFDGHIKVGEGLELMYERNFFHTDKNFSLEWGVSIAGWQSRPGQENFYTLSIFPELKVWIVRLPAFDFYFTYSLAGPSYISRRYIYGVDSGSHFTFQDFLGLGSILGKKKLINISLKIVHYSNGNTIPENPGVDVPVMVGIGFSW